MSNFANIDRLAVFAAMSVAVIFGAQGAKHNHVWDDGVVTTPATCTQKGVMTYTCVAGGCTNPAATKTEEIPQLGHLLSKEMVVDAPATYDHGGQGHYPCLRPGCTYAAVYLIPQLVRPSHPYSTTWIGGASGAWETAANWELEITAQDTAVFTNNATVSVTTASSFFSPFVAALSVGRNVSVKIVGGVQSGCSGDKATVLVDEGATLEANGSGTNFEIYNSGLSKMAANSTVKATEGARIKVNNPGYVSGATNVTFFASGTGSSVVCGDLGPDMAFIAENGGSVGLSWGTTISSGHYRIVARNGGTLSTDFRFNGADLDYTIENCPAFNIPTTNPGKLRMLVDDSSVCVKGSSSTATFGSDTGMIELKGAAPALVSADKNTVLTLANSLKLKLVPQMGWSETVGRINTADNSARIVMSSGLKYEIDVSNLTAAKTFCLVSMAAGATSTAKNNTTITTPSAEDVTLVGTGAEDYDCTFTKDGYTVTVTLSPRSVELEQPEIGGTGGASVKLEGGKFKVRISKAHADYTYLCRWSTDLLLPKSEWNTELIDPSKFEVVDGEAVLPLSTCASPSCFYIIEVNE